MISIRKGTVIGGKYRLEEPLARGGMGSIWVARHIQLDVLVAVKFIDPDFASTAEGRSRFEREAKSAAMLHSPHVVQIHDYGVEFETPYIAMELLQGEDLSARLKREGRLSLEAAAKVAIHVSKALRRAHDAGIVHRDLKPSNIFIVYGDEDDELIKVLDFGVAKDMTLGNVSADETKRGALIGSPRYMSPEQARRNREIDHRSDLWSLGVILFRAVTGRLPFPGDEIGDVIVKICSDPLPLPSVIAPDLGPDVDRFFFRALSREPAERFQSAREMASEFAILAGALPPASRFTWPLPGDGMRISWLPGAPTDQPSLPGYSLSLVQPPASSSTPRSVPPPTLSPPNSGGLASRALDPPSAHPPSVHPPSAPSDPPPAPPVQARPSPAPMSATLPVHQPITIPPSTPTLLEQTRLTERPSIQERAKSDPALRWAGPPSSSSDATRLMPGRAFDDIEQAALEASQPSIDISFELNPVSSKGRPTPPTRLDLPMDAPISSSPAPSDGMRRSSSDDTIDKLFRGSSPSGELIPRKSSPSVDKVARKSSPSVEKVERKSSPSVEKVERKSSPSVEKVERKSSPAMNPSATLTSSTGTVDIPLGPPGRAAARSRRSVVLWLAVACALVLVSGAMAIVRLSVGQGNPTSAAGVETSTPAMKAAMTSAVHAEPTASAPSANPDGGAGKERQK